MPTWLMPDFMILDLSLPGKDGRAVLAEVKADPELRKIPIAIFSTSEAPQDIIRSYELGRELLCQQARQPAGLYLRRDFNWRILVWAGASSARGGTMNNGHTNILLIEDNPGDADLVRLRLIESDAAVNVSCVNRLEDGLASISQASAFGGAARSESSRQSRLGYVPQSTGESARRADRDPFRPG